MAPSLSTVACWLSSTRSARPSVRELVAVVEDCKTCEDGKKRKERSSSTLQEAKATAHNSQKKLCEESQPAHGVDENLTRRASGRSRAPRNYYVAEAAPAPHVLRMAMKQAETGRVLPSEVGADGEHHARQPPPVAESAPAKKRARTATGLIVDEYSVGGEGYEAAKAELSWEHIDAWANQERLVVRRSHLKRLLEFTTKILLVREPSRGRLVGCALLSEADNSTICDSLHSHRNPSLPLVKTARMGGYAPIHAGLVRGAFDRALSLEPIDELVLICGERGCGSAVMAQLRGRPRFLYASVVPGSARVRAFYDKHFGPLAFERRDGEWPYAVWLGSGGD